MLHCSDVECRVRAKIQLNQTICINPFNQCHLRSKTIHGQ